MSFNPFMVLLAHSLVDLLEERPTVIEIGNQTLNPGIALDVVIKRSQGHPRIDLDGLQRLKGLAREDQRTKAAEYYRCLGFSEYKAIDTNDRYDSLVMDLNKDIRREYGFDRTFSLVTNNGTGEHIFDQASVFRNVHNLTKKNGISLHILPWLNHVNHGFYNFQPNLFYSLAKANNYRIITVGLGHREGYGVIADPGSNGERLPSFLLEDRRMDLKDIFAGARIGLPGRFGGIISSIRRSLGSSTGRNPIGEMVVEYEKRFRNVVVFAVMRKLSDAEFRSPFQEHYVEAISDPKISDDYAAASSA